MEIPIRNIPGRCGRLKTERRKVCIQDCAKVSSGIVSPVSEPEIHEMRAGGGKMTRRRSASSDTGHEMTDDVE